jgi:hypothetical protein
VIEDDLRAVMREHDHEAPRVAEFLARHRPGEIQLRKKRWIATGAAAACVVMIAVALSLTWARPTAHDSTTAPTSKYCPQHYPERADGIPWVPADPTTAIDGRARLAPDETPTTALVCFFGHTGSFGHAGPTVLTGSRSLTGDLHAVTEALTFAPPATAMGCTGNLLMTDYDDFLIRLTYPGGVEWVAAPGDHCTGSSNGQFVSATNLRALTDAAYRSGHWPTNLTALGRLGQQTRMVPLGSTTLKIAWTEGTGSAAQDRSVYVPAGFSQLVDALNSATAKRSTHSCLPGPSDYETWYQLTFGYAEGPGVFVQVSPGCHPSVDNNALQADNADEVVPIIQQLLNQH